MTTMSSRGLSGLLALLVALGAAVASAQVGDDETPETEDINGVEEGGEAGLPPFLTGDKEMPPGLADRDVLPPGLAKKLGDNTPPGQAKKAGEWVPPGQAKKTGDWVPPGQARNQAENTGDDDDEG
jgi:hypothetical protein